MAKYSFVIPVRNGEKTIAACLDSIFSQSLNAFEVIVVDNQSTDATKEICQRYPEVQYLACPEIGRSFARNAGARKAKYQHIVFVDCDVVLDRHWLRNADLYIAKRNPDLLATSVIPHVGKNKSTLDFYRWEFARVKSEGSFLSLKKFGHVAPVVNAAAFAIKKKCFFDLLFEERLNRNEDFDLSVRAFFKGYLIAGTRQCKSYVFFASESGNMLNHLRDSARYCLRAWEVNSGLLTPFEWSLNKYKKHGPLLFQNRHDKNFLALAVFVEIFSTLGAGWSVLNPRQRKLRSDIVQGWTALSAKNRVRCFFAHKQSFYQLQSHIRVIYVDDRPHLISFKGHLDKKSCELAAKGVGKLLANQPLNQNEITHLVSSQLFSEKRLV